MAADRRLLTGWGRTAPTAAHVIAVHDDADVKGVLAEPPRRGVIARGLGRSYGDAAQNAGGVVLDMNGSAGPVALDPATGLVTVSGGTSLDTVMRQLLPRGWFVPVTPGTRHVTGNLVPNWPIERAPDAEKMPRICP